MDESKQTLCFDKKDLFPARLSGKSKCSMLVSWSVSCQVGSLIVRQMSLSTLTSCSFIHTTLLNVGRFA